MAVATQTKVYDESKFSIEPTGRGYEVYYDGKFWETADSYSEAENDIREAVVCVH